METRKKKRKDPWILLRIGPRQHWWVFVMILAWKLFYAMFFIFEYQCSVCWLRNNVITDCDIDQ